MPKDKPCPGELAQADLCQPGRHHALQSLSQCRVVTHRIGAQCRDDRTARVRQRTRMAHIPDLQTLGADLRVELQCQRVADLEGLVLAPQKGDAFSLNFQPAIVAVPPAEAPLIAAAAAENRIVAAVRR